MFRNIFFKKFILPGLIFQSLVIGGGYGTGRELVEFFLLLGPKSGLYGMIISLIIWCIVLSFTFDLSRKFQTYDYRSFLKKLLGKGWVFYEITYLIGLVLVISVLASASGNLLNEALNISNIYGSDNCDMSFTITTSSNYSDVSINDLSNQVQYIEENYTDMPKWK